MKSGNLKRAIPHLKKADPKLSALLTEIEAPKIRLHKNYFKALVGAIISQQLSDKAAATIMNRFKALYPEDDFPTPNQVLKTRISKIRQAGVSAAKANYIKGVASAIYEGKIDFSLIKRLSDDEVIAELTKLKGIGVWTAEMFLIFSLGREDVFSAGDLGLKNAIKRLYGLKKEPDRKKLHRIALRWQPYRSYASLYLWASLR